METYPPSGGDKENIALIRFLKGFRSIVEKSADAIIITDKDGVVRFVNPMTEIVFGREKNELIGELFGYAVGKDQITEIDIMRVGKEPGIGDMSATEIEWEGEPGFVITIKDVTDRRLAQEELKRTAEQLELTVTELKEANRKILEQQKSVIEEERVKVLLQMSGATAHELNQPLTILLGYIELIRLREEVPQELTRYLDNIKESGKRIADIVQKIHSIRRYETKPSIDDTSIINIYQKIKVLSVENSDLDFEMVQNLLKDSHLINLSRAKNMGEAIEILKKEQIDLILLDYLLPDGNGLDLLEMMEREDLDIPVTVITDHGDEIIASKLIKAGAYDYMPKENISAKSLIQSINNSLEKFRLKKDLRLAWDRMTEMSTTDKLTSLYNRGYFMNALKREVARTSRYETGLILAMIGLDRFKTINDIYGRPAGDIVLSGIGKMLKETTRLSDLACRYGGEEFALIFPNTNSEEARTVCERFREMVAAHPFEYASNKFHITASIGIASYRSDKNQSPLMMIAEADQRLYQAKDRGGNCVVGSN